MRPSTWSQHPLSSALLLQPHCGTFLFSACCSALEQQQRLSKGLHDLTLWEALRPFFSFVLLQVWDFQP